MTSIYQRALGADFDRLHPQLRRRFGLSSADQQVMIGIGLMDEIRRGPVYLRPFLYLGASRHILFPEHGLKVPFTIENYAYVDRLGRETVAWLRTFHVARPRRFDAYMIYSEQRQGIVDYLGTHQHLAVDLTLRVDEQGCLCLTSHDQRFYEGIIGFRFPRLLTGVAAVREGYDDATGRFTIEVDVRHRFIGSLFGYRGSFSVEWRPLPQGELPAHVVPRRLEARQ